MLPPWSTYCCPFTFHWCKKKKRNISCFSTKTLFKMRCISGQYKKPWAWAQFLCGVYFTAWLCIRKSCWLHAWFSSISVHFTNCWREKNIKSGEQSGFESEIYRLHICCYCCWCWCWETCWQKFDRDLEAKVWSRFWCLCLIEILKLMLGQDSEAEIWSKSCDVTWRIYIIK